MSVKIGHASISEKGTVNGTKGDSTGKEVCIRDWYSKPWDYMAIHPDATVREKHAAAVEAACANNNVGYGQSDRNTLNTLAKAVDYDLSKVGKCNCDCSSLQNVAAVASGASGVTYGSNGWTTSTMKAALQAAGYKIITASTYLTNSKYCVRGAIYVKASSHTVCGLDNGANYKDTLTKAGISTSAASSSSSGTKTFKSTVKQFQSYLNSTYKSTIKKYCGALLDTDNSYGTKTRDAALCAWKYEMNKLKVGYTFDLANSNFGSQCVKYGNKAVVKKGSSGKFVYIMQGLLRAKGYYTGELDGDAGTLSDTAIREYQKAKGLTVDGSCGANTWKSLFN